MIPIAKAYVLFALTSLTVVAQHESLWEEQFERLALDSTGHRGWRVVDAQGKLRVRAKVQGGVARFSVAPGLRYAAASRYVAYDFDPESEAFAEYLQVRVAERGGASWAVLDGSLGGTVIPSMKPAKTGLFTASYALATRPDRKGKKLSGRTALNVYVSGKGALALDFLRLARRPMEGVYLTLTKADGAPTEERETVRPGDHLLIEMPNPEPLDATEIALWRVEKGQLLPVAQANLPPALYDDGTHGDRVAGDRVYSCGFVVSAGDVAVEAGVNTVVADVQTWGQDHHYRGHFYGFLGYAVDLPAGAAKVSESALRLFDFGPKTSAVLPGAAQVTRRTKYTPEREAGWTRPPYGEWTAKMPDALTQDCCFVRPGRPAAFRVDVPPGRYHVEVCTGFAGWVRQHHLPFRSYRVTANGVIVYECDLSEEEWLQRRMRYMETDYRTDGGDVYDVYLAPILAPRKAVVEVRDGTIEVRIEANGAMSIPACWLAVYPADGSAAERDAQARLDRIERQRRESFHGYWSLSAPPGRRLDDPLTLADDALPSAVKEAGYAVFTRRDPFEVVYIYSRPRETELLRPVSLLACQGQVEPASIGLYPLRELKSVRLDVTDLVAGPARIAKQQIGLSYAVQFHYANLRNRVYWVAPNHFLPAGRRDLEAGACRNYWLRVRVPDDAAPGVYRGTLTLAAENARPTELPIRLRVLPLQLPELDDHLIAFINHMFFRGDEYLDTEAKFMRDLGCTAGELHFSWATTCRFDIEGDRIVGGQIDGHSDETIGRFLDRYKKVGFPFRHPVMGLMALNPGYGFRFGRIRPADPMYRPAVQWCYRRLAEMARAKGFDGIVAYLGGEMGSGARDPSAEVLRQAAEVVKIINEVPHVATLYDCNCGATARELSPLLDIAGMRQKEAWEVARPAYRRGRDKWLITYSTGGRYWNGFDSWRHGARGNFREYLTSPRMLPYNGIIGFCLPSHVHATEGFDGPVPTVRSETWRAAVDDRRYLRLLETEIERHDSGGPAVREAKAFLDALRADFDAQPYRTFRGHWRAEDDEPRDIDQNLVRWLLAAHVLRLQGKAAIALPAVRPLRPRPRPATGAAAPFEPEPPSAESTPQYDDGAWVPIRVGTGWEAQGIVYDGVAWYRTSCVVPERWTSPWLHFEAVDEVGWVYLNGQYVGTHDGWNEPFALAAAGAARPGERNVLAVRVLDTKYMGGIWKSVWLCKEEPDPSEGPSGERRRLVGPWKLALRPERTSAASEFKLKFGKYYRQGEPATIASLQLFPPDDETARRISSRGVSIEIADAAGQALLRERVSRIGLYRPNEARLSLAGLAPGSYCARTVLGERTLTYDFHIVPRR